MGTRGRGRTVRRRCLGIESQCRHGRADGGFESRVHRPQRILHVAGVIASKDGSAGDEAAWRGVLNRRGWRDSVFSASEAVVDTGGEEVIMADEEVVK